MLVGVTPKQARAIVGAMAAVAPADGELTGADRASLLGARHYLLRQPDPLDSATLDWPSPTAVAVTLTDPQHWTRAARMLTVIAFVDGRLDAAKIAHARGRLRAGLGLLELHAAPADHGARARGRPAGVAARQKLNVAISIGP